MRRRVAMVPPLTADRASDRQANTDDRLCGVFIWNAESFSTP